MLAIFKERKEPEKMAWIETKDGYVNLATARSVRLQGSGRWVVYDADGERHLLSGVFSGDQFLADALETVVPASGRDTLHVVYYDGDGDPETFIEVFPIIGWRVSGDYAQPIIPGTKHADANSIRLIALPGGKFLEDVYGDAACFDSIEAARAHLIKEQLEAALIKQQRKAQA
jgi:hypothetical protein